MAQSQIPSRARSNKVGRANSTATPTNRNFLLFTIRETPSGGQRCGQIVFQRHLLVQPRHKLFGWTGFQPNRDSQIVNAHACLEFKEQPSWVAKIRLNSHDDGSVENHPHNLRPPACNDPPHGPAAGDSCHCEASKNAAGFVTAFNDRAAWSPVE